MTQFLWQWEDYKPREDSDMTRERANRLLRAWRAGMRKPRNGRPMFQVKLYRHIDNWREYRVTSKYGESASMWIR